MTERHDVVRAARRGIDTALEIPVVTSFTRIGPVLRRRLWGWSDLADHDLGGRTVVVTGATSGLGRAAAVGFARLGAHVVMLGRDAAKTARVRDEVARESGSDAVSTVVADMGELDTVHAAAARISAAHSAVDVLVHNAGALSERRTDNRAGIEMTVASQVLGPFLLTALLLDPLRAAAHGSRVITMSSGGMYAAALTVDALQMDASRYRGAEQYARAKRAQVTLNEMWAERVGGHATAAPGRVVFQAMHPGWADTPGVAESLPTFRKVVGPLLRTPEQGVDTLLWLAADDGEPLTRSGAFWLDRRVRPIHRLPSTRKSDTPERRARLWQWCVEQTGVDPA